MSLKRSSDASSTVRGLCRGPGRSGRPGTTTRSRGRNLQGPGRSSGPGGFAQRIFFSSDSLCRIGFNSCQFPLVVQGLEKNNVVGARAGLGGRFLRVFGPVFRSWSLDRGCCWSHSSLAIRCPGCQAHLCQRLIIPSAKRGVSWSLLSVLSYRIRQRSIMSLPSRDGRFLLPWSGIAIASSVWK